MRKIIEYELKTMGRQEISMPQGAEILIVLIRRSPTMVNRQLGITVAGPDRLVVRVLCDETREQKARTLDVVCEGQIIPDDRPYSNHEGFYLGSVEHFQGLAVVDVFDVTL